MLSKIIIQRRERRRQSSFFLNLTPMIDVMTVLLGVFMMTAPLLTSGLDLNLPQGGKSALSGSDQIIISLSKTGEMYLTDYKLTLQNLLVKVKRLSQANPKSQIVIAADSGVSYGKVVNLMGALRDVGFKNVGLQTQPTISEP